MTDTNSEVILHRLSALTEDIGEIRVVMKEMAAAMTQLALVEERQTQSAGAISRAFAMIDKIELRVAAIEREMPTMQQSSAWVIAAVGSLAGAAVLFVAKQVGVV